MIRNFKLNKNSPLSGIYTIVTSNIYKSVWAYLGRFKSKTYVKENLEKNVIKNKKLIEKKSEDISYLIRQSEEFFNSSLDVDISIKPLLIYYGMLGLTKSLIISGDNEFIIETLRDKHHGLSFKTHDKNEEKIRFSDSLVNEFCLVKKEGIYQLFRSCYCEKSIPPNTKIVFKTLLSLIGENWQRYYDYFKEYPNIYTCWKPVNGGAKNINDNKQLISIDNLKQSFSLRFFKKNNNQNSDDVIFKIFPILKQKYEIYGNSYINKDDAQSLDNVIYVSEAEDEIYFGFVQPFKDFNLTDFDVYFLIFFILSNLCRYYQDKWFRIVNQINNYEFFLIENIFEIAQYKFPLLILRELENKDFVFIKHRNF